MRSRDSLLVFLLSLTLLTTLTGCTNALTTPADPQPSEQIKIPIPTETLFIENPDTLVPKPSQTLPAELVPVEPPNLTPMGGEVPEELLEEIIADLVQRTGANPEDIQVAKAEAVVWNDGSLGCPKPGEFYIQILINGYWVVLQVESDVYDYRASDSGGFTLCE